MKDYNYYKENYHRYKRFGITIKFTYNENEEDALQTSRMFKTQDEVPDWNEFALEQLSSRKENKGYDNIELVEVTFKQLPDDEWLIGWFDHWTFDDGRNDEETLVSFEAFLQRATRRVYRGEEEGVEGRYVSMGANDRWRWHGKEYADDFDPDNPDYNLIEQTDAPCRCKYCKEFGLIKICH